MKRTSLKVHRRSGLISRSAERFSTVYCIGGGEKSQGNTAQMSRCGIALALRGGKVGTQVGGRCGLREFRTSADVRVPFPQGKGTKGCRGPTRFPCGAPAPGPPSDKYLVSVEPRRGAPDGVPFGSALTAPLKTFRFQRGPVLGGGKARRGEDVLRTWRFSYMECIQKKPPLKGEVPAKRAGGFVPRDRDPAYRRRVHLTGGTK